MTSDGHPRPEDAHLTTLRSALRRADLSLEQLWTRFFALGGSADLFDLEAHLEGLALLTPAERDVLAHVVNERLDELVGRSRVPYSRPLRTRRPSSGPLAALAGLLDTAHTAAPEHLPELASAAGRALGVQLSVHVVDHEQRLLIRLPTRGRRAGGPLRLEGTPAGRAYCTDRILSSERDGRPRLWVPMRDGADRLGVLEVEPASPAELHDPSLREQCRWVAGLLGRLLASVQDYGDDLARMRRTRPRTAAAELIWQQLPPLTGAMDAFVLAGMLEPTDAVGGDAFDYALSERTISLAIFDGVGHGLRSGLLTTAALAAYRSSRRDARGLDDQARAIDDVVASTFQDSLFVTGVLAELDVGTGRLRYVRAGHPPPLLLREGQAVTVLDGGRRTPFGLGPGTQAVAEEFLQPGDWLVLYTDGITEARNAAGRWFGEERLAEFLTREVAAGHPPAEAVRRLTRTVLNHHDGPLRDDASILLGRWDRTAASAPSGDGAAPR